MGKYKFRFSELQDLSDTINKNARAQIDALDDLNQSAAAFASSSKITGEMAKSMQTYFPGFYGPIITALKTAIGHHAKDCMAYLKAYENARMGQDTQIDVSELEEIKSKIKRSISSWSSFHTCVASTFKILRTYKVDAPNPDIGNVKSQKQNGIGQIDKVMQDIASIEGAHKHNGSEFKGPFAATSTLLQSVTKTLQARSTAGSIRVKDFGINEFWNSPEGKNIRHATLAIWYDSFLKKDIYAELDTGIDSYDNYDAIIYVNMFQAWTTAEDIENFYGIYNKTGSDLPGDWEYYFDEQGNNPFWRNWSGDNRNCTWYAWGRFMQLQGKNYDFCPSGDAFQWYDSAQDKGLRTSQVPEVGSIVVWDYLTGEAGHVAVVEEVLPNGDIKVSQSGWSGKFFTVDTCKRNPDGSYTMVYNGYERNAVYRGAILPDKSFAGSYTGKVNTETPLGKMTEDDKEFIRQISGDAPIEKLAAEKTVTPDSETSHASKEEIPKETLKEETIKEAPKEAPKEETTKEAPKETPKETIKETSKDTPKDTHNKEPKEVSQGEKVETPKHPAKRLSELNMTGIQKKLGVTEDGVLGPETIKAIQKEVGAVVDGYWGTETSTKLQEYLGVTVDGFAAEETLTALNEWSYK